MRHKTLAVMVGLIFCAAASAGTTDPQLMAPIQKFVDSFNKGDAAAAAATHSATDDLAIMDEVPPYLWRGPQAFRAWSAALESDSKKRGITDQVVKLRGATRIESNGDQAYVIVPAVYDFKENGVPKREIAQMTVVLNKGAGGWLIHGWVWTGPKPRPVSPAKR